MIQELPVFPQIVYSENGGISATRKWILDYNDNVDRFVDIVARSSFPNEIDCVPVQIQIGPYMADDSISYRNSNVRPRYVQTLGELPVYNKILVVATYALHKMTNCWPARIPKPWHPPGTVLSLRVTAGGQMLLVSPSGMEHQLTVGMLCPSQVTGTARNAMQNLAARIRVPVAEIHLTCERLTRQQLNQAFGGQPMEDVFARYWGVFLGTVNGKIERADVYDPMGEQHFLGCPPETLLFDGYTISEHYVADVREPLRYALTATFKFRILHDDKGEPLKDKQGRYVGWNHDYVAQLDPATGVAGWDWTRIVFQRRNSDGTVECYPRYPVMDFSSMFGKYAYKRCGIRKQIPDITVSELTVLSDNALCESEPSISSEVSAPSDSNLPDFWWFDEPSLHSESFPEESDYLFDMCPDESTSGGVSV